MKYNIVLLFVLLPLILKASPALPVIYTEHEESRTAVEDTGSMTVVDSPGVRNDKGTPRGSAAGRLAVNGKEFLWKPSQIKGKATGGADLISAVLSGDETVLLIAERIGGTDMPNSTRLVLINLRNNRIIRSVMLRNNRISELHFIPGSDTVLAVRQAQSFAGHKNALIRIDLRRGRITAESYPAPGKITSVCTDGASVWYTVKNTPYIFETTLENFKAAPEKIRTRTRQPKAAVSHDGAVLLAFGKKYYELFRPGMDDKKTALMRTVDIPDGFAPNEAMLLDDRGGLILMIEQEKKAVLYINGTAKEFPQTCGSTAAFFKKDNLLLLGLLKQNAVAKVNLPDTVFDGKPVIPGKLKPLSRNGLWKMLPLTGDTLSAVIIDTRGNVMRLEITKRRWKKHPVLIVDRTGFR